MPIYEIKQGDHLSRIANRAGLDFDTVWNLPENADLKKKRENPNVLLPGDEVFVPERQKKSADAATDQHHTYKKKGKPLKLRLIVQDSTGEPVPNAQGSLDIDGSLQTITTDGDGLIEITIPHEAENAVLRLRGTDQPFANPVKIRIGHLDPIDTETGWIGRLNNLGYLAGSADPPAKDASAEQTAERDRLLKSAVEEFQCDHKLTVDGKCGRKTQGKLQEVYGC